MSIDLTPRWQDEELSMFRDSVGRFLEAEMAPHDEEARKQGNVGHAMWRKVGEMGLLCTDIPEQYGGAGGDFRHEAVVAEEMGKRGLTGLNHSVHSIVAHYFLNHGTDEQKDKYLPRMARGELVGAIAMTEPGTGVGPAKCSHSCQEGRRSLRNQWFQDLYIQWLPGRCGAGGGENRYQSGCQGYVHHDRGH